MASYEAEIESAPGDSTVLKDYLLQHEPVFQKLSELRKKVWSSEGAEKYFEKRQEIADNADDEIQQDFFRMAVNVGSELASATNLLRFDTACPRVLDLCMAPGGFSASVLNNYPNSTIDAITLPPKQGGYQVRVPTTQINLTYSDVTMYAAEYGTNDIPPDHPDSKLFRKDLPYANATYDLIFCGGAVLRQQQRNPYRERHERSRLLTSQLILAFQRIKPGGTIVLLLHQIDSEDSLRLLQTLNKFASIQLFKHEKVHAVKSSFYAVLQDVQPVHPETVKAVGRWKRRWHDETLGVVSGLMEMETDEEDVTVILEAFGARWRKLGRPVWKIQERALRNLLKRQRKVRPGITKRKT